MAKDGAARPVAVNYFDAVSQAIGSLGKSVTNGVIPDGTFGIPRASLEATE